MPRLCGEDVGSCRAVRVERASHLPEEKQLGWCKGQMRLAGAAGSHVGLPARSYCLRLSSSPVLILRACSFPPCRQGTMERWDSSCSRWQRGHLVLTRAGHLHFFSPESAAAKAAAASGFAGSGGGGSGRSSPGPGGVAAPGGSSGGGGASRSGSTGQLSWGGASSWTPPVESLNLSRCSFEQGGECDW